VGSSPTRPTAGALVGDIWPGLPGLVAAAAYQAARLDHHNDSAALLDIAARTPELAPAVAATIADRRVYAAGRRHDPDGVLRFRDEALLHPGSPDARTP
jgi:hypothetical protein